MSLSLEALPVTVIKAKKSNSAEYVDVLVDGDYDGEWFSQIPWRVLPSGYVNIPNESAKRLGLAHEYLAHFVLPPKKGYWISYKDGNKLNCRSANLYYQTPSDSALARPLTYKKKANSSQYRGVHKGSSKGTMTGNFWYAYCKGRFVGAYPTEMEAAKGYDERAKREWGDRAVLNFKEEDI